MPALLGEVVRHCGAGAIRVRPGVEFLPYLVKQPPGVPLVVTEGRVVLDLEHGVSAPMCPWFLRVSGPRSEAMEREVSAAVGTTSARMDAWTDRAHGKGLSGPLRAVKTSWGPWSQTGTSQHVQFSYETHTDRGATRRCFSFRRPEQASQPKAVAWI